MDHQLIHIEDGSAHSDTTDEYLPVVQLGKQFKQPLGAAISMEDIRSNSTNQKSQGSPGEEVIRKFLHKPSSRQRAKSREQSLDDSQKISYKLMQKPAYYTPADFHIIQEAIMMLKTPMKKRSQSSNARNEPQLITQRHLVDSVEKVSSQQSNVYRLILKIHSIFESLMMDSNHYGQVSNNDQVQILIEIFNEQRQLNDQRLLAVETHYKCLMQKAFLSFLDNMAQSHADEVSFRISQSGREDASIEKSPVQLSGDSPSPAERKLLRKLKKESSPVRAFLNDPEDQKKQSNFQISQIGSSSLEVDQNLPEMIQISTMFDKGTLQSNQTSLMVSQNRSTGNKSGGSSVAFKNSDNYKLILKCLRIWKLYTRQEIQDREAQKQQESLMEQQVYSEIELSREMEMFAHENQLAVMHRESKLLTQGLKALITNIFEQKNYSQEVKQLLDAKYAHRMQYHVFEKWLKVVKKIKSQHARNEKFEDYRSFKVKEAFVKQLKDTTKKKGNKVRKFNKKSQWQQKGRVIKAIRLLMAQRENILANMQLYYEINRKQVAFKALNDCKRFGKRQVISIKKGLQSYRVKAVFFKWAEITQANQIDRTNILTVQKHLLRRQKEQFFFEWVDLTSRLHEGTKIYERTLKKKVFRAFTKLFEKQETKDRVIVAMKNHLGNIRMKNIIKLWRIQNEEQQKYRNFQLHVFSKMDRLRLKQTFKGWFNLIDILKRWRFLNENTDQWIIRKTRKRVFRAWKKQIKLKNIFFEINDKYQEKMRARYIKQMVKAAHINKAILYIKTNTLKNFKIRFFQEWSSKVNRIHILRARFKARISRKFIFAHFSQLRNYSTRKIKFRNGMKNLLKLRANNLMKTALNKGLKRVWREKKIEMNLWKAAIIYHRMGNLKKSYKALNKKPLAKKHGAIVLKNHCVKFRQLIAYKRWLNEYLKIDEGRTFLKRIQIKRTRLMFDLLLKNTQEKLKIKERLKIFDQLYCVNLQKKSIGQLQKYGKISKQKKIQKAQIATNFTNPLFKKKLMRCLQENAQYRRSKKDRIQHFTTMGQHLYLQKAIKRLHYRAELKKRLAFMKSQVKNRILYNCMAHLNRKVTNRARVELFSKKRLFNLQNVIFDGICRYRIYRKYFREKENDLKKIVRLHTLKSCFQKLQFFRIQNQFDSECVKVIERKRAIRHLNEWRELLQEAIEETEERHLANELFAKHMLRKLQKACRKDKGERNFKSDLLARQTGFYEYNSKLRAVTQLFKWMSVCKENANKIQYAQTVVKQRSFEGWKRVIDLFKRKRILSQSSELMLTENLYSKGLRSLRMYADKRIHDRLIIDRFQQRNDLAIKAEMIAALYANIQQRTTQRELFYEKTVFLAQQRMVEPFHQWKVFALEQKSEDRAKEFFMKRSAQYLKRLSLDALRINKVHQMQKHMQNQAVDTWHCNILLQKVVLGLKLVTHRNKRYNAVTNIIKMKIQQRCQREYFDYIKLGTHILKQKNKKHLRASRFFKQNTLRKALIALAKKSNNGQQFTTVRKRQNQRIVHQKMLIWFEAMTRSRSISRLVQILQDQEDSRMAHKFIPKLVSETFVCQVFDHMEIKRVQAYQQEFINQVRKSILQKKILQSVKQRNLLMLKRSIFVELQLNVRGNQDRSFMIENHIENVEDQTNTDILQIAFNSLKNRVVMKRFKKIADGCYKLKQKRNCLGALEAYTIRRKINEEKGKQVQILTDYKYFGIWRKAYLKEIEKDRAQEYVQATLLFQIMSQWRELSQKSSLAKRFNQNVTKRNTMSIVLQAWAERTLSNKLEREKVKIIKHISNQNTQAKFMQLWLEQQHESNVGTKMTKFWEHKQSKHIFTFWRTLKSRKNEKRMRIHLIRQKLQQKPGLGRPLHVLKNMLLFKAFNKLQVGAKMMNHDDEQTEKALFAYYLKVVRKTFFSLRLNAQVRYQEQKTYEISDLFLKKRWLNYIKLGTSILKDRRQQRHKASIFRFLSLQKKGMEALIDHSCGSQEIRIKKQFAMRLYYKRLLDLGFAGLRAYTNDKQAKRAKVISPEGQEPIKDLSPRIVTLGAKLDPVVFSFKDLNQQY